MHAGVMHPSASTQDLIRATRPKFPEGLKVRPKTRIASRRVAPPVTARPPDRGTTVSTSSHSGRERFPRHLPCTPSPATPRADATRDPQTQVLVVVKDESRHAPIKKLLQEIGYKGANAHASQPRVDRGQPKRDFTHPRRSLESSVRVARTRTLSGRSARLI